MMFLALMTPVPYVCPIVIPPLDPPHLQEIWPGDPDVSGKDLVYCGWTYNSVRVKCECTPEDRGT